MKFHVRSVYLVLVQNLVCPLVNCSSFSPFPQVLEVIKVKDEFIGKTWVLLHNFLNNRIPIQSRSG